ncbi:glycosyltransferase 61 family protein [Paracoccus salsus]|uniref:glycosyltransferase 61 family protein n=1 Tax=Paracoccus salsus TaxID=2911061 RepID=UPI001F1E5185|nr:glycosyltransferase 61 family protein [Paracoccus salsus]MCF3973800.1 glycosyltransferase family 61 protein [Paracoccus salsus]
MLNIDDESDDLVLLENALVVPPDEKTKSKWQPSGVLDQAGQFVENSISWSSTSEPVNSEPKLPEESRVTALDGTFMFAGISYGHFGHFITESLSRIWALDELRDRLDGLIFTPKFQMANNLRPFEVYDELVKGLGIDLPITCPAGPVRVARLYVPKQGFGLGDLTGGSRKFRQYVNRHAGSNITAKGASKIYISRSELPTDRGGILGEAKLEAYLRDEGYEIYHPQKEKKIDQLAQYKAARQIIAVDCSPLHLVGYVGHADQNVGIVTRRSMAFGDQFVRQLTEFKGMSCHIIDALENDWLPGNTNRPSRSSFGEVSLSKMYGQLKSAGLIHGTVPWTDLTPAERNADIHRQEERHDIRFKPMNPVDDFVTSKIEPAEQASKG